MKAILDNLNRSVGVIGSAVMTHDGIVACSAISDGHDQDALAAIGSSLLITAQKSLRAAGAEGLSQMAVDGTRGKIVIINAGTVFLLVITDSSIDLDHTLLDIRSTVRKLKKVITMDA
jgi:predicted regulator of Ras-like GTPase activity (Roadblock/LC7/MglB family)